MSYREFFLDINPSGGAIIKPFDSKKGLPLTNEPCIEVGPTLRQLAVAIMGLYSQHKAEEIVLYIGSLKSANPAKEYQIFIDKQNITLKKVSDHEQQRTLSLEETTTFFFNFLIQIGLFAHDAATPGSSFKLIFNKSSIILKSS